jgi:ribosomal protein S18 acetylase RimI-like enzyme
MDVVIRQMTQSDLYHIKQVIDLSFPRFYRYFSLHSLQKEGHVLVGELAGRVVGFAKIIEFNIGGKKSGCILWIAVHPAFRRKGIAGKLTTKATYHLKRNGVEAVFASTQRRNVAALSVLSLQGFKRIGFSVLRCLFGWRVFQFYNAIWFAPGEMVLMHN